MGMLLSIVSRTRYVKLKDGERGGGLQGRRIIIICLTSILLRKEYCQESCDSKLFVIIINLSMEYSGIEIPIN